MTQDERQTFCRAAHEECRRRHLRRSQKDGARLVAQDRHQKRDCVEATNSLRAQICENIQRGRPHDATVLNGLQDGSAGRRWLRWSHGHVPSHTDAIDHGDPDGDDWIRCLIWFLYGPRHVPQVRNVTQPSSHQDSFDPSLE